MEHSLRDPWAQPCSWRRLACCDYSPGAVMPDRGPYSYQPLFYIAYYLHISKLTRMQSAKRLAAQAERASLPIPGKVNAVKFSTGRISTRKAPVSRPANLNGARRCSVAGMACMPIWAQHI